MTQTGKRRRIEAAVSGPVVLALFGWFVLTACSPELNSFFAMRAPPTPGPDAVYDGMPVHENPDGSVTFGTFHCDGQGKYVGGGDPDSEKRFNDTLKSQLESAKNEIKTIERDLQRCGGKKKFQYEYDTQAGCNRDDLRANRYSAEQLDNRIDASDRELLGQKSSVQNIAEILGAVQRRVQNARRADAPPAELEGELAQLDRFTAELRAQRETLAKEQKHLEELKAERAGLDRQPNNQRCSAADEAAKSGPCSEANFNRLDDRHSSLQTQAAVHQNNKDRFDKCTDDRKRRAQAPSVRPAVDPSFILNQPGLWNRPASRPSRPAPPPPSHPHKE